MDKMLGDRGMRFEADEVTNRVIAFGTAEQMGTVEALLQRLDESKK